MLAPLSAKFPFHNLVDWIWAIYLYPIRWTHRYVALSSSFLNVSLRIPAFCGIIIYPELPYIISLGSDTMQLNSSIILDRLSETYRVEQSGKEIEELILSCPHLFIQGIPYKNNQLYVGHVEKLPRPSQDIVCLVVGVGGQFPSDWSTSSSHLLSIPEETSVEHVFNLLSDLYEQFTQWDFQLCDILLRDACLTEMISISIPIVGNPITFTNNRGTVLQNSVICESLWLDDNSIFNPLTTNFWDYYVDNCKKEGFHFYRHETGYYYFSNIYCCGAYVGVLVMQELEHPLTPGRCVLFRHLYERICLAMEHKNNLESGVFNSIKSAIVNLLQGKPTAYFDSKRLKLYRDNRSDAPKQWICAVIQPRHLPSPVSWSSYSDAVENCILNSFCVYFENCIVALIPLPSGRGVNVIKAELTPLLHRFEMCSGISDPFGNPADLRSYYRQAVHALEHGIIQTRCSVVFSFRDYAMHYMLRNSHGDIPVICLIPDALLQLRSEDHAPGTVDYWHTLKTYLNNEMNVAQTARELYIHRSTLQSRLDKIAETIPLDTPEQRFLIRYYINLYESTISGLCL